MIGDGKQWVSWVHIDDVTSVIDYIIQNKIFGPINLHHLTQLQMQICHQ